MNVHGGHRGSRDQSSEAGDALGRRDACNLTSDLVPNFVRVIVEAARAVAIQAVAYVSRRSSSLTAANVSGSGERELSAGSIRVSHRRSARVRRAGSIVVVRVRDEVVVGLRVSSDSQQSHDEGKDGEAARHDKAFSPDFKRSRFCGTNGKAGCKQRLDGSKFMSA